MNYFIHDKGHQYGPLPMEEIARRWRENLITEEGMYAEEGASEWKRLMDSTEMASYHPPQSTHEAKANSVLQVIATVITIGIFVFLWSTCQPSAKRYSGVPSTSSNSLESIEEGVRAGMQFARSQWASGVRMEKESNALKLTAKSKSLETDPKIEKQDFTIGFQRGYKDEWNRLIP